MPDNPELIERYDGKLSQLLTNMHNDGIRTEVSHFLLSEKVKALELQMRAEGCLSQCAPEKPKKGHENF